MDIVLSSLSGAAWDSRLPTTAYDAADLEISWLYQTDVPPEIRWLYRKMDEASLARCYPNPPECVARYSIANAIMDACSTFSNRRIERYLARNTINRNIYSQLENHPNAALRTTMWATYNHDFISEHILPKGDHCYVALCFRTTIWLDYLSESGKLDKIVACLKEPNYMFGSRLQVINIHTIESLKAAGDLASEYSLVLPNGFPEDLPLCGFVIELEAIR